MALRPPPMSEEVVGAEVGFEAEPHCWGLGLPDSRKLGSGVRGFFMMFPSRRQLLMCLCLGSAFSARAAYPPTDDSLGIFVFQKPRTALPSLVMASHDGHIYHADSFKGRITVVNLWASWCLPCITELPALDRLQAHYASQLKVIALNVERKEPAQTLQFAQDLELHNLEVLFNLSPHKAFPIPGIPHTIVLDHHGTQVGTLTGIARWDGPEALAFFDALIQERAPS